MNLAEKYGKVVKDHHEINQSDIDSIVNQIKEASKLRNMLCHASWRPSNSQDVSRPFFVNRQLEIFETDVNIQFLKDIQNHVAALAIVIIKTVTQMGYQFPGSNGAGKPVF